MAVRYYKWVADKWAEFEDIDEKTKRRTFNIARLFEYITTHDVPGKRMVAVVDMMLYTLAFAFGSCEVERQGRTMNLTKTIMRTNLGDDNGECGEKHMFLYLCFLKSEMPALEHVATTKN